MIPITIQKPVWYNKTISIRKEIVLIAAKSDETFEVVIKAKPYTDNKYQIKASKVLNLGKDWIVKGTTLVNFPIDAMYLIEVSNK